MQQKQKRVVVLEGGGEAEGGKAQKGVGEGQEETVCGKVTEEWSERGVKLMNNGVGEE